MAITKTKRTKRVLDPVDNTQIDYDKLADAIIRKQNRPGPQLIQDNPSSDTSGSSGIVVDNDVEQPTLQPPTIEPQNASAGEMHVQHAMNSSLNMHETAQSSFLLALDQLFGGESLSVGDKASLNSVAPLHLSAGIPLGATVPLRIKQKIWANKFVDMHTLLPDFQEDKLSLQVEQGSITVASQRGKKNPLSIYQWTNAFLNFASVYLEVKSDEAPHLLKYMSTVRQIHATNGDMAWRYYDENFRMLREFNSLPWQQPLGELMVRATTIPKSTPNNFRPSNKTRMQSFRGKPCYAYNNGQPCLSSPCTFKHICLYCKDPHPRFQCSKAKNPPTQFGGQSTKSHNNLQNPKSSQPSKPV